MRTGEAKALAAELAALVDVLVPGDDAFPPASEVGVQAKLADRWTLMRGDGAVRALDRGAGRGRRPARPAGSATGAPRSLTRIERERPDDFLLVRNIVYLSYYESPAVHEAIRAMGFTYHATPAARRATTSAGSILPPTRRATAAAPSCAPTRCGASTSRKLDFLGGGHG